MIFCLHVEVTIFDMFDEWLDAKGDEALFELAYCLSFSIVK